MRNSVSALHSIHLHRSIIVAFLLNWLQSAHNRILIINGKVVNADVIDDADVYIEEGVIK